MGDWRSRSISIALLLILHGCADSLPATPPVPSAAKAVERDEIQSSLERQMVILFQGLLQMDRREQLSLTYKQATAMLPMVELNTGKGKLMNSDQLLIMGLLSSEQKQFIEEFQKRQQEKEQAIKEFKSNESLSFDEREAMIHEFERKRREKEAERLRLGKGSVPDETHPGSPPGVGLGSPKNVEQQLLDLLEARTTKHTLLER